MNNPEKQKQFSRRAMLGGSLAIAGGGVLGLAWLKSTPGKAMTVPGSPRATLIPSTSKGKRSSRIIASLVLSRA
jgi:hypothetical protein